jgi:hypothetical protein
MCKGEADGELERRMMPADSNLLNSALAISIFCVDQGDGILQKRGGGMNVMLNAVGRLGQHIPGAQNGGVFLKQEFNVGGTELGMFCKTGDV